MLAQAGILDHDSIRSPVFVISMFAISGILGWPFSLAVSIPFLSAILIQLKNRSVKRHILRKIIKSSILVLGFFSIVVIFDSIAFKRLQIVPLNIVLYNVLGSNKTGPDIFGTEDWTYYVLNLVLNFNVIVILALFSVFIVVSFAYAMFI